jgi:hypothetical protein
MCICSENNSINTCLFEVKEGWGETNFILLHAVSVHRERERDLFLAQTMLTSAASVLFFRKTATWRNL